MENTNNSEIIDLGSEPVYEDFDPFAADEETIADNTTEAEAVVSDVQTNVAASNVAHATPSPTSPPPSETTAAESPKPIALVPVAGDIESGGTPAVFEYAGATENIDDSSKTFDELRIEKAVDFPELEDGKRVSWTVEYGKITKTVPDPKGTSIGKMKSDIETSKEFTDSLKKPRADKNPVCKVKPRVTAQSKGTPNAYKGVFTNIGEADAAGKIISIVPSRDGKVYEIRNTEVGRFTTPVTGCDMLSEIRAGFIPALPRIPAELTIKIFAFFRHFACDGADKEALLNIYWDKENNEYVIDAPEQVVSKVSVDSHISEQFTDDRYIHYMDIHSHNTMEAFFSQVDDHDEKATRLYAVVGKLNECVPEVKTRISNGGKFLDIDPTEVFEHIGAAFPNEWKDKVHFQDKSDTDDNANAQAHVKCEDVQSSTNNKNNAHNLFGEIWAKIPKIGGSHAVRT